MSPIIYVNPAFERITGYSADEILGKNCRFLQGEDEDQPDLDELRSAIRDGREVRAVLRNYRKDGTMFWNELYISPVRDENGNLKNFIGFQNDVTERKHAEEQYRAIFESTTDALLVFDTGGTVVEANPAACEMHGYTCDELVGMQGTDIVHRKDYYKFADFLEQVRAGKVFEVEGTNVRKDGARVGVEVTGTSFTFAGTPHLLAVVRDVTGHRRAEEDRERLFSLSLDLLVVVGFDGYFKRVNPAFEHTLGYTSQELYEKPFIEFVHPEDHETTLKELEKLQTGDPTLYFENRYCCKGGAYVWLAWKAVPLAEEGLIYGFARNITERKQAEEELREYREQLEIILEGISEGVSAHDSEGQLVYMNEAHAGILGYASVQEFLEKPFEERFEEDFRRGAILDEAGRPITPDQLPGSKALRGEEPPEQVIRYRQPNGQERWLVSRVVPVFGEEGEVQLIITIVRDITESRRVERVLRNRARQQAAVADISKRALVEADLTALMEEAVAVISRILEIEYCKVLELLPDGERLLLRAGVGWEEGMIGRATVNASPETQAGFTLASDGPVVSEDLESETRFSGPPLLKDHGVVSGMSVVIRGYDKPYGVLGAHTIRRREFSPDDVNFLRSIANVLATAIERQHSEEWMRFQSHLLDQVETAVIYTDLEGKVNYWNEHAEKLYGYTREEVLGSNIMDLTVGPSEAEIADKIMEQLRSGKTWEGEFVTRRKDGSTFYAHVVDSTIYDANGQVAGIVGISTDITERKRAEEALMEIREAERRRIARDLHDLVLQDLASLVQSMQATQIKLGAEQSINYDEEIEILRRATKTMRETVFDLRSEVSKSLVRGLESLVEHNRQMVPEREVTLEVQESFPDELPERTGTELLRVVQEALVNVRRHSDADNVTVGLRVQDGEVRVEVTDDGCGFASPTNTDSVGLSSMRERIALLGGELEIDSKPGKGTTIEARIPYSSNSARNG